MVQRDRACSFLPFLIGRFLQADQCRNQFVQMEKVGIRLADFADRINLFGGRFCRHQYGHKRPAV
jgi:hypothetical protein